MRHFAIKAHFDIWLTVIRWHSVDLRW